MTYPELISQLSAAAASMNRIATVANHVLERVRAVTAPLKRAPLDRMTRLEAQRSPRRDIEALMRAAMEPPRSICPACKKEFDDVRRSDRCH